MDSIDEHDLDRLDYESLAAFNRPRNVVTMILEKCFVKIPKSLISCMIQMFNYLFYYYHLIQCLHNMYVILITQLFNSQWNVKWGLHGMFKWKAPI